MTVASSTNRNNLAADGLLVDFSYTFRLDNEDWLEVYVDNSLVDPADYTVDLVTSTVTFLVAPGNGSKVTLYRSVPLDQVVDYTSYGKFPAETHERALDKVTMIAQQLDDANSRSIKAPITDEGATDYTLPNYDSGKPIQWDPSSQKLINGSATLDDVVSAAQAAQAAAESAEAGAESAEIGAVNAEAAAGISETNAAASEAAALASENKANEWAEKAEDSPVEVGQYSSLHYAAKAALSAMDAAGYAASVAGVPVRNCAVNQAAIAQTGAVSSIGMASITYTGNGTSQSVINGPDMSTGEYGGLVWIKSRDATSLHCLFDTVRGAGRRISSHATGSEVTDTDTLTSFNATGFSLGDDVKVNAGTEDYVAWCFQTQLQTAGTTNRNKLYVAHYNPQMGFSIVGYDGDGVDGHEIPHHLGRIPELSLYKNRNAPKDWHCYSPLFDGNSDFLVLNSTAGINTTTTGDIIPSDTTIKLGTATNNNATSSAIISYHFTSIPGVSKIGKYIGTGNVGNYVDCGFKPAFLLIKRLDSTSSWVLQDSIRGDNYLLADSSAAEAATTQIDYVDDGFVLTSTGMNALNGEYIFLAFAEDLTGSGYAQTWPTYPLTADTLNVVEGTLLSFAEGYTSSGEVNTQEVVPASTTVSLGAGYENGRYWLYKDKGGSYGFSAYRPLEGMTRNTADKWGVESPLDASLRTTARHFDYESETGVALASGYHDSGTTVYYPWGAFEHIDPVYTISGYGSMWLVASTTTSWLQYKFTEKRVLKSWRIMSTNSAGQAPRRFTIEGSNDGYNWTAIDSTYTSSDYTDNGVRLWGDLQDTSANTTAYLYHRINITANNGDATYTGIRALEFNTILPADYYLVGEGKMYDSSDTEIDRIYLAEVQTDDNGGVSWYENLPVAKLKGEDMELQGDLKVHGEIENRQVATAWVRFDGTQNPPLIYSSYNVKDVVDLGTGAWRVLFETPMANKAYTALVSGRIKSTWTNSGDQTYNLTTDGISVNHSENGNADTDRMNVAIFGGKEIK